MTELERCPECDNTGVIRRTVLNRIEKWNRKLLIAFGVLGILGLELQGLGISFVLIVAWFPIYYVGWLLLVILIATKILRRSTPRKLTDTELKLVRQRQQPQVRVTTENRTQPQ